MAKIIETNAQKRALFVRTLRELGYSRPIVDACAAWRYGPRFDATGRPINALTASSIRHAVDESAMQEAANHALNRIERAHGSETIV